VKIIDRLSLLSLLVFNGLPLKLARSQGNVFSSFLFFRILMHLLKLQASLFALLQLPKISLMIENTENLVPVRLEFESQNILRVN
jgi:hypothetical protein